MFYFVLAIHFLLCVILIGLVLLQQGKGASVGAILSGSSNTLFGATGANSLLVKMTTGVAVAFMFTSIVLIKLYGGQMTIKSQPDTLNGTVFNEMLKQPEQGPPSNSEQVPAPAAVPAAPVPESGGK